MPSYKDLYYSLFNELSDVIEKLKEIQSKAEDMYVNSDIDNDKGKEE